MKRGAGRPRRRLRPPRRPEAWALAVVPALVYGVVAVQQWRRLHSPSWDLGIFTQLVKAYGNLEAPIVPIKGEGFHLLGDHFHPILVLLGPVYRIFPSGLTLLLVQALLLAISVVPLTTVAVERLGRAPGLVLGASYAFSFGLQGAVQAQFHEIAFAVPLLAFALAAFLRGRWAACALWAAPLVLVKEDLGLTVVVLGLVLVGRGASRAGWALAAWGAVWFVVTVEVILPALNPRGQWDYPDRLSLGDVAGDPLGSLAEVLTPGEKTVTVLLLVGVAGVVGLRSPLMLLLVPTLAWRFLGDVQFYWGWTWHYNAVLMPVAVAALLDAIKRPADDDARSGGPPEEPAPARRAAPRRTTRVWGAVLVSLATSLLATPDLVLGDVLDPEQYRPAPRSAAAAGALDAVADGATVAADISLLAYLVPDATVYWSGNPDNPVTEYVLVDRLGATWGGNPPPDAAVYAEGTYPGSDYEVVYDADGYQVARLVRAP